MTVYELITGVRNDEQLNKLFIAGIISTKYIGYMEIYDAFLKLTKKGIGRWKAIEQISITKDLTTRTIYNAIKLLENEV